MAVKVIWRVPFCSVLSILSSLLHDASVAIIAISAAKHKICSLLLFIVFKILGVKRVSIFGCIRTSVTESIAPSEDCQAGLQVEDLHRGLLV